MEDVFRNHDDRIQVKRETWTGVLNALELALGYLQHPDVQALPFAFSAEAAAARAERWLAQANAQVPHA